MKVQQFALCAQVSNNIAIMSDEERIAFEKEVPPFMKHCPHIYVMQKQAAMSRQHMQQQQQQQHNHASHSHYEPPPQNQMNDPSVIASITKLMSDPNTRSMMEKLSTKMSKIQVEIAKKVTTWTQEQKNLFFQEFSTEPLVDELNHCGNDPVQVRII